MRNFTEILLYSAVTILLVGVIIFARGLIGPDINYVRAGTLFIVPSGVITVYTYKVLHELL